MRNGYGNEAPKLPKPTDWDELYPGRFLKAGELKGKKVTLTIAAVDRELLEGDKGKQVKGVLAFVETERQLALNKTNGICVRDMFGRNPQLWVGKRLTIFPGQWDGEPCIRVWGSPDLAQDMQIIVQLPKRKPIPMTMHAVRPNARPQQQQQRPPQPEPEPAHDEMDPEPPADQWGDEGAEPGSYDGP